MNDTNALLAPIRQLHAMIRDEVVRATERAAVEALAQIDRDDEGDTIYAIDRVSEELVIDFVEREISRRAPIVLIAEGLHGGKMVLPRGARETDAAWRIIVDPIDGTRGLMYQKRSAWILTGVAANHGERTSLADIELAVHWVLGNPQVFLKTVGDVELLPKVLNAASRFRSRPPDEALAAIGAAPLFS